MKYIILLTIILFSLSAMAQPGLLNPRNFTWNSALSMDFPGLVFYSHDLGESLGLHTGVSYFLYNTGNKTAPYVINMRAGFYTLEATDNYQNTVIRTFVGVGAGLGFHIERIIFGTVNGGYLYTLTTKQEVQRRRYGTAFFGGSLSVRLAQFFKIYKGKKRPSRWEMFFTLDLNRTIWDIEGLDRGAPDKHEGSYFGTASLRWQYFFE